MDIRELKIAMHAAWAAGYDNAVPSGWLPNMKPPRYLRRGSLEGYIFENPAYVILAFQGTEVSEYQDILADLDARKIKVLDIPGKWHRGFAYGAGKFWVQILLWLKYNLGDRKLLVTGFSLGAALAQVLSIHLTKGDYPHTVYAFGGPRVCTPRAGLWLSRRATHYRIHTYDDWVTHMPPFFMGFKHFGSLSVFTSAGKLVTGVKAWFWAIIQSMHKRTRLGHHRLRYLLLTQKL